MARFRLTSGHYVQRVPDSGSLVQYSQGDEFEDPDNLDVIFNRPGSIKFIRLTGNPATMSIEDLEKALADAKLAKQALEDDVAREQAERESFERHQKQLAAAEI